jgi:hypothetical protein
MWGTRDRTALGGVLRDAKRVHPSAVLVPTEDQQQRISRETSHGARPYPGVLGQT